MNCTTHHQACICREKKVAVLHKTALDGAFELKRTSTIIAHCAPDKAAELDQLIARIYAAADALTMPSADGSTPLFNGDKK